MRPLKRQTLIEQAAGHLREGFHSGRWSGKLPGVRRLAADLDVSPDTVRAALHLLESEGVLKPCGAGRSREIVQTARRLVEKKNQVLRVALLLKMPLEEDNGHSQQLLLGIMTAIEHAGHECFIADKALSQLGKGIDRLAKMVRTTVADAWVVYAAGHKVLAWFAAAKLPVMALGGRRENLPIAISRTDLSTSIVEAVDELVAHQHRRIVMIGPRLWRRPVIHPAPQVFLQRLAHHGLSASSYNLPDWEENPEGLQHLLAALFLSTPPTALMILEPSPAIAAFGFLAQRGLRVPEDVSIISMLSDPVFAMWRPMISHFDWPIEPHIRRITRWVRDVALGRADTDSKIVQTTFAPGGTIGPAKHGG